MLKLQSDERKFIGLAVTSLYILGFPHVTVKSLLRALFFNVKLIVRLTWLHNVYLNSHFLPKKQ